MFYSFQHTDLFTSFVRFVPMYFIIFGAVVHGIFTSISNCLLLVDRLTVDFLY